MTVEYDHGRRVTPFLHEQSALDRAISEFEGCAKAYYKQKGRSNANETEQQKETREKDLASALRHLKVERLRALTQIQVCFQLEEYQQAAKIASEGDFDEQLETQQILMEEKHHPTDKLANLMRMEGRPQPSPQFTPHHIVQGKGKRDNAYLARVALHAAGIGINDPNNGAWMPRTKADKGHWAYPNAMAHCEIHTINYETWVLNSIRRIETTDHMRTALIMLRTHLKNGTQPPEVTMKPNQSWNGK